ncbi:hypothetical protein T11_13909 [Trichinella zimbabwensis]|uniref:Uncharacterized protein n=1 Tax=Trichinella zimbabwensis TaxID=268475 RepID=A0A0V1I003_9BILA|nr:hypothetical protein T11_13909 [Trichinella zimbabwensis]
MCWAPRKTPLTTAGPSFPGKSLIKALSLRNDKPSMASINQRPPIEKEIANITHLLDSTKPFSNLYLRESSRKAI